MIRDLAQLKLMAIVYICCDFKKEYKTRHIHDHMCTKTRTCLHEIK